MEIIVKRIPIVLSGLLAVAVPASAQYRIIDLGTLGGQNSHASGINERGQIVGWAITADGGWRAVLWNPLPVIRALEVSPQISVHVAFTAVPATSTTTYHLETADAAGGPWTKVADAALIDLEPNRYQFTAPLGAGRTSGFWRIRETVP